MKPKFLYHASPKKDIEIFEPRAEIYRDPKEGPVVFATPSKAYASMFLVPSDDSWTSRGRFNGGYYHLIADEKRYRQLDKGGAIYTFNSQTFETDFKKGMGDREWTSRVSVKPIKKEVFSSGVEAMKKLGVRVSFVNLETFQLFVNKLEAGLFEQAFALVF